MKTTAIPSAHEPAQRREQRLDLLRDEHRGRLVEDEHPAVAVERLQDLDALLLADRERRRRERAGSTRMPKRSDRLGHRLRRRRRAARERRPIAPRTTFSATVIGRTSAKCCVTIPIPAAIASCGEWIVTGSPVDDHLHRRRAASARKGSASASSCRRRSRRAARAPRRARPSKSTPSLATSVAEALGDAAQLDGGRRGPARRRRAELTTGRRRSPRRSPSRSPSRAAAPR